MVWYIWKTIWYTFWRSLKKSTGKFSRKMENFKVEKIHVVYRNLTEAYFNLKFEGSLFIDGKEFLQFLHLKVLFLQHRILILKFILSKLFYHTTYYTCCGHPSCFHLNPYQVYQSQCRSTLSQHLILLSSLSEEFIEVMLRWDFL